MRRPVNIPVRAHAGKARTDDERDAPSCADVGQCGTGVALVTKHVVPLAGVDHVDKVMTDARALLRRRFGRPDVHSAVDLTRIGGNDLSANPFRDAHGKRGLAGRGRADDGDHVRTVASSARSASRARATVAWSGAISLYRRSSKAATIGSAATHRGSAPAIRTWCSEGVSAAARQP